MLLIRIKKEKLSTATECLISLQRCILEGDSVFVAEKEGLNPAAGQDEGILMSFRLSYPPYMVCKT